MNMSTSTSTSMREAAADITNITKTKIPVGTPAAAVTVTVMTNPMSTALMGTDTKDTDAGGAAVPARAIPGRRTNRTSGSSPFSSWGSWS
nr:hypothetical protein [uncultured Fretibacterium sp.]